MHTQASNVYRQGSDGHVALQPRLDYSNTLLFHHSCNNLLTDASVRCLRLDCAQLTYIDSSGIGELVSGFTTVTNNGGQLKLLNLTKRVKDLLQITKLYTVFEVFDDEATAVRSFA